MARLGHMFNALQPRVLAAAITVTVAPYAFPAEIPVDGPGWDLKEQARVAMVDGKQAIEMRNGFAFRRDVKLMDGTIEFDARFKGERSFAYIHFRMESDEENEELYFRPHKSGLPDTLQYTPEFQHRGQWQLFHDASSTASADLPVNQWFHVRLVLQGQRGLLFLNRNPKPALQMDRLARKAAPGYIAFRGFSPDPGDPNVAFANLEVKPGVVEDAFPAPLKRDPLPSGLVRSYSVSSSFVPPAGPVSAVPESVASGSWTSLATEDDGLLIFARSVKTPSGRASVAARLSFDVQAPETRRLDLGFSDEVTVLLNGRPVFAADARYSYNFPRQEGLLFLGQSNVYLPLRTGKNEVTFIVTDGFGGMGLMVRDAGALP